MKTLLFTIALFLTVSVSGQDGIYMGGLIFKYKCEIYATKEKAIQEINEAKDLAIDKRIVELYREYAVECWNDSTLSHTQLINFDTRGVWAGVDKYGRDVYLATYKPQYIHAIPTLPGFMEFIERKINTEKK